MWSSVLVSLACNCASSQAELLSTGNDGLRNQLEFDVRQFVALLQILDLNKLEQRIQHFLGNVGQPVAFVRKIRE